MKIIAIITINIYQVVLSPILKQILGISCRYEVSCSAYAKDAILENGFIKGSIMGFVRLLNCQPFGKLYESI